MNKQEVIERLCKLTSKVANEKFKWDLPADCVCGVRSLSGADYRFDERVLKFIEDAVEVALGGDFRTGDVVCFKEIHDKKDCGVVLRGPDPERTSYQDHVLVKWHDMEQPGLFEPSALALIRREAVVKTEDAR